MMDIDLDFSLAPSETIYGCRAIKLDVATAGACYLGSLNSMCVGVTPQQSQLAPGQIGNTSYPYILGEPQTDSDFPPGSSGGLIPVYGPGRRCLIDIDPNFAGQIRPGSLIISGNSGYGTLATPTGAWNQWIIGIATSFANGGQSCNVKVVIFPWLPTGS